MTDLIVVVGSGSRAQLLSGSTRTAAINGDRLETGEMDIGRWRCEARFNTLSKSIKSTHYTIFNGRNPTQPTKTFKISKQTTVNYD